MIVCMSALKEKLETDLSDAMRARDEVRTRTLRMALTAVKTEEVAGKQARVLSDDDIVKVLTREAKKRREAATAFDDAGRDEQARAERDEGAVLEDYLPAQLGDDELAALVADAIAATGAEGPRAMGQVMKAVNPKVAGRAEGGRVAAEVKRQLAE
ncbi:GatB/YqeY domain-containing protein [Actinomadura vinacea]|uniref:GatB/YqeY domain-containing protein n=2 Tax=Actinomadura vinacea TaxID=115336 RepID=A0ABN3JWL6_9ACTN